MQTIKTPTSNVDSTFEINRLRDFFDLQNMTLQTSDSALAASNKSTTCKTHQNTLLLCGEYVTVSADGYWWLPPVRGSSAVKIGEDRMGAIAFLQQFQNQDFAAAVRRVGRPRVDKSKWRPYYWATSRAKRAGLPMMSRDEYEQLWSRASGRCEVSGMPFSDATLAGTSRRPWGPSIDRIECAKGYQLENSRLVCSAVNLAMNEYGLDTLRAICVSMAANGKL